MASGPDLFVVCKSCGSEVSPYVTECPYCGTRVRKRAPKLGPGGAGDPRTPRRRPTAPSLGRLRSGEIPGIRGDELGRPYATLTLVVASALLSALLTAGVGPLVSFLIDAGDVDDPARLAASAFAYAASGYEAIALVSIALFGWLLERRLGGLAPLLVFSGSTAAAIAVVAALGEAPLLMGGNAAALGLLGAWVVPQARAARRRDPSETDWYGVAAFALVLLALPLATASASAIAGLAGGVAGLVLGHALAPLGRR